MKKNTYFDQLAKVANDYDAWKSDYEARREQIIKNDGWDTEEYKNLQKEKEDHPYPISSGACKAYRAWRYSDADEVVLDDFLWDNEVEDFLEAFKNAGINSFIYTNQSTAVMGNLHSFSENGCKLGELVKEEKEDAWGFKETMLGIKVYC